MRAGRTASCNINTGTFGTPIWSACGRISSPKRTQTRAANARTYRAATTKKNVLGLKEYGYTFTYVCKAASATDTILAAFQDSYDDEEVLDLAILDRAAVSGAKGIRGPFQVSQLDLSEDDEDAVSYEITVVEVEDETIGECDNFTVPS
jgi:hypothetical protein